MTFNTRLTSVVAALLLSFSGSFVSAQITVSGGTGLAATYTTLTNAGGLFAAINATGQGGNNIVVSITGDMLAEAGTNSLNAGAWTTITISPSGGAWTISGTTAAGTPLINFNGADNVTINGLNTGGNSLTISNLSTGSTAGTATIRFINDATNNTVTNCTVLGSATSTIAIGSGTILFHTTSGTTGNDGNTISLCNIGPAGANTPSKGIMSLGTTTSLTTFNSGIQILNNNIFDFFRPAANCWGMVVANGDNWTVNANRVYQTAPRTFTLAGSRYTGMFFGITSTAGGTHTITNNVIGFASSTGTGTTTITGTSNVFRGIDHDGSGVAGLSSVQGNTISGINQTTSSASTTSNLAGFIAIKMGGAISDAPANIGTTTGNTIGSLDGSSTIVINASSTTASTAPAVAIYDFNFASGAISNNNIGSITINNGGTGTTVGFRGIFINSTTGSVKTIANNTIGGTATGSITDNIVGAYAMYGIQSATANINATGNIIRNMTGNSNLAGTIISSAMLLSGSTGVNTIAQNQVYGLHNNSGAGSGSIYALSFAFPATANIVERNFVHSLSMTASVNTGQVVGMISRAVVGTTTYRNNMVRLGLDATGATVPLGCLWIGMWDNYSAPNGGSNNYYHNSVYIGGSGVTAVANTYAFFGQVLTNTRDYRNNIFWNARSNATAGGVGHAAIFLAGTTPNPAGLTCNYNDLFANGNDGIIGVFNAAVQNPIATWRTATGMDLNSQNANPLYKLPTGTSSTVDLHILKASNSPIESNGQLVASVTADFDNDVRATSTPTDIGADAGNFRVYYSQTSGNVTDPIWDVVPVGVAGPAVWPATMVVQNTHTVTNTANVDIMDLTVDMSGTLVLNGSTTMSSRGDAINLLGTVTANDNSELALNGSLATTLSMSGTKSFWNLTANNAGTTVTGNIEMRGTLLLSNGNFNCTGNQVTLRSTATETGRLGPVAATASYTGNMKIERYIPAGATNWRLLGSPIQSRKVNHWMDDFVTAGFPGSQVPWFDNPVGSGILWPSIRWYDETNPGAAQNDGRLGATSNTQNLSVGQGFAAWCGDNLFTTNAFVIDLENQVPVIASTPVSLPMTWTNTGNVFADGWNLVSNPVPSPIAFDQIVRGADVGDFVTYYNPANGNTAVWDISLNSGTNSATNTIQSMQGFFLKATGASVTTTVSESAKVAGNSGGMFGTNNVVPDQLRLSITSAINTFSDETVVIFSEGTPNLDESDALKYVFADVNAPQIACVVPEGVQLAINAYGSADEGLSIPVSVNAGLTGEYTITLAEVGDLGLTCFTLEDTELGIFTVMNDGGTYTFGMNADDDDTIARFILRATAPIAFSSSDALCGANPDGQASVELPVAADVTWTDDMGNVILAQAGAIGNVSITGLGAGSYEVHVSSTSACGELVQEFTIAAPFVLEAQGSVANATCADSQDGSVDLLPLGGVFPYTFIWNDVNTSTTEDLTAASGSYTVVITDANNCTWTSTAFVIDDQGPDATLNASATSVIINTAVQFSGADVNASYIWDFGDGTTSTDMVTEHMWSLPGVYTVTLTVSNALCTVTTSVEITVELNTAIAEANTIEAAAWHAGDHIVVQHAFTGTAMVRIDLLDATGRLAMQRTTGAATARVLIPANELATGIWFVRMAQGEETLTLRVPVVH